MEPTAATRFYTKKCPGLYILIMQTSTGELVSFSTLAMFRRLRPLASHRRVKLDSSTTTAYSEREIGKTCRPSLVKDIGRWSGGKKEKKVELESRSLFIIQIRNHFP